MKSFFIKIWWWITGQNVCYANCQFNYNAFCKRRSGHWGNHRTGSGFTWK